MIENWNEKRFNEEVLKKGRLSAVEFYGEGLPVCQTLGKPLDDAARRFEGRVAFGKINVKNEEALAEKYAVRSVPTLMVFCGGLGVGELVGRADTYEISQLINGAINKVGSNNF